MENIKNFIKKHKKDILLIGGTIVVIGGCIFIMKNVRTPKVTEVKLPLTATFLPNAENGTVDLFIGKKMNRSQVWSFGLGELQSLAVELDDSAACIWPHDWPH